MAVLFDLLTGGARAALPFLTELAATDLSANAIIDKLKEFGLGFQRQQALNVIGALRSAEDPMRFIKLIGEEAVLPEEAHTLSVVRFETPFHYVVETNAEDLGLPEAVTVVSDVPLSAGDIYASATSMLSSERYPDFKKSSLGEVALSIIQALRSPE